MQTVLFWVAIAGAVVCFGTYCILTFKPAPHDEIKQAIKNSAANVKGLTTPVSAGEIADLLKALASLTDSLVKAGPALWSLIGSILFLLVASIAAGLIGGKTEAPSPPAKTQTSAPANVQAPANQVQPTNGI